MVFFNILFFLLYSLQTGIPPKPKEDYKIELEYIFKQKASEINNDLVEFDPGTGKASKKFASGSLPYLLINFKVIKLSEGEVRIKVINNTGQSMLSKKAVAGDTYKLDLGYTDDMKDRVTAHEFNVYFLTDKKKEVSVVTLFIGEDGTFMVNGEVRGKF